MSLASRVSLFSLVALAAVLAGFSGSLYLLARADLTRQLDSQLESALDILEASVDIEPGGLEWEPADRRITLGVDTAVNAVRWAVRDGDGVLVDRSPNAIGGRFPDDWMPTIWPVEPPDGTTLGRLSGWRLASRRLRIGDLLAQGRGHPDDEPGFEVQYSTLILVVGLEPAPIEATMARLGLALVALSSAIWASAAVAGRWLCRRALRPVRVMADAATSITAPDLGRLPVAGSGDELEELGHAFNGLLDRLDAAFARMNEAYEQQSRFAGDASHQLRTPLAALLGQVEVACRRERSPEEYRRVLEVVRVEGRRLRQVVESLLLLAQPARMWPESRSLELSGWARDHLLRWSSHPRASDLEIEADAGPLVVQTSPTLVAQILDNLLENASKYSAPGTPIRVQARREGNSAVLSVEDRGSGIMPEDLAHIFEPFYRADRARLGGHKGSGLGLAVAHRIAESLGGTIEVHSEMGVGSRFLLRLPCESAARPEGEGPERWACPSPGSAAATSSPYPTPAESVRAAPDLGPGSRMATGPVIRDEATGSLGEALAPSCKFR